MTAGPGLGEQEKECDKQYHGNPEGIKHAGCLSVVKKCLELISSFLADAGADGIRVAVSVYHISHASGHEHGSQGCYEWRKLEFPHQNAVYHADGQAADQCNEYGGHGIDSVGHQGRRYHSAHAHHGTDG